MMKPLSLNPHAPRIAMVAGEASGDQLGGQLIAALKHHLPEAQFFGMGGEHMRQQGLISLFPVEKLAVRGYIEVLKHLPDIWRIRRTLKRIILAEKPDVYIGIDAPDFNLGLEKIVKQAGIPTVHYVGPSVWMWRKNRIDKIRQAVSHLLLILPFEQAIWDKAGVAATYVGHPLADMLPLTGDQDKARTQLATVSHTPIIALLPGSRLSEVEYLSAMLIDAAKILHHHYPQALFLVPLVTQQTQAYFVKTQYARGAAALPIQVISGRAHEVMQAADVVVVASGTATLEVALAKKPMVIIYKISQLTYWFVKNKFYLPYFGLPNIIAQRFVVPELMQNEATAENIAHAVTHYLVDQQQGQQLKTYFTEMHQMLRCNAAMRAAETVLSIMREAACE
jgi:lipid-A-disaccharide synthase